MRAEVIEEFLRAVDKSFPVALSEKQDLHEFSKKLHTRATVCAEENGGKILSMVCGYTDNVIENRGYISVVATRKEAEGRGYAKKLVGEFLEIAREKGLSAVHVYAAPENTRAVGMYKSMGFSEWKPKNEPRPGDMHLIYVFEN